MAFGYAYSNNGASFRAVESGWALAAGEVYFDHEPSAAELATAFPSYTAAAALASNRGTYAAKLAAGIVLTSTGTPALDGTYALDPASQRLITAIYVGIKGGDGLPGGAASFNYPDMAGAMHSFTADQFSAFAKAVRDYLYALDQAVLQTNPSWPAPTLTIA